MMWQKPKTPTLFDRQRWWIDDPEISDFIFLFSFSKLLKALPYLKLLLLLDLLVYNCQAQVQVQGLGFEFTSAGFTLWPRTGKTWSTDTHSACDVGPGSAWHCLTNQKPGPALTDQWEASKVWILRSAHAWPQPTVQQWTAGGQPGPDPASLASGHQLLGSGQARPAGLSWAETALPIRTNLLNEIFLIKYKIYFL